MPQYGVGRPPPNDHALVTALGHRQMHLMAVLRRAYRDDERAEVERELAEVDDAIKRGMQALSDDEKRSLWDRYGESSEP